MSISRKLTKIAKLGLLGVLIGTLIIAFTSIGVGDFWKSSTAEEIDRGLKDVGDSVGDAFYSNDSSGATATDRKFKTSANRVTETKTLTNTATPAATPAESTGTSGADGLHHTEPEKGKLNEERIEDLVHEMVKEKRGDNIRYSDSLAAIARYHSRDMANHGELFHESPETGDLRDRLNRFGAECGAAGENAAYTYLFTRVQTDDGVEVHNSNRDVAEGLVSQWMHSDGHRRNLLNPMFDREGIGVWIVKKDGEYLIYATQVLCE